MSSLLLVECFPKRDLAHTKIFHALSSVGTPLSHVAESRSNEIYGNPIWVLFPYTTEKFYELLNIDRFLLNLNVKGIVVLANEENVDEVMHLVDTHKMKHKISVIFPEKEGAALSEIFHGVNLYNVKKTARMIGTVVKVQEEHEMEYHA